MWCHPHNRNQIESHLSKREWDRMCEDREQGIAHYTRRLRPLVLCWFLSWLQDDMVKHTSTEEQFSSPRPRTWAVSSTSFFALLHPKPEIHRQGLSHWNRRAARDILKAEVMGGRAESVPRSSSMTFTSVSSVIEHTGLEHCLSSIVKTLITLLSFACIFVGFYVFGSNWKIDTVLQRSLKYQLYVCPGMPCWSILALSPLKVCASPTWECIW